MVLARCNQIDRALARGNSVLDGDVRRMDDLMVADVVTLNPAAGLPVGD